MRMSRIRVAFLVLLSVAMSASSGQPAAADPVTLLEVSGPKVGVYMFGQVATHYDKLVVSFTTTVPLVDVTIDVGLGLLNTTVYAFLTDRIGPGTGVGNEIASSIYSGAPGTNIPLFNNLSLGIGTYYLVLDAIGGSDEWNRLLPFDVDRRHRLPALGRELVHLEVEHGLHSVGYSSMGRSWGHSCCSRSVIWYERALALSRCT